MEQAIDLVGVEQLRSAFARAPDIAREELLAAMTEADALVEREVKERTPRTQGLLAGSITSEERVGELGVVGLVGTSLAYAEPVEFGSKPHMPPVEPLIDWVRQKLGISDEREASSAAWAIAKKISVHGTKGAFMFKNAFEAMQPQVRQIFEAALGRIAARIGGAR